MVNVNDFYVKWISMFFDAVQMDHDVSPSEIPTDTEECYDADVPPLEQAVADETVGSRLLKAVGSAAERGGDDAVSMHCCFLSRFFV